MNTDITLNERTTCPKCGKPKTGGKSGHFRCEPCRMAKLRETQAGQAMASVKPGPVIDPAVVIPTETIIARQIPKDALVPVRIPLEGGGLRHAASPA